jgi:putative ATP-dependent endonuclease of the OLD family
MHIRIIRLWNFRKFGNSGAELDLGLPSLEIPFQKGINLLVGPNDSGKTAVIDAIKIVCRTHSQEWIGLDADDFYQATSKLRIELEFALEDSESSHFVDWLVWENSTNGLKAFLQINLEGEIIESRVVYRTTYGTQGSANMIPPELREFLKVTYLRPLRDAKQDLTPKRNSRLSQILLGHSAFRDQDPAHYLIQRFAEFNASIKNYFEGVDHTGANPLSDVRGKELKDKIDSLLKDLSGKASRFNVGAERLKTITERLELSTLDDQNQGLGTLNLLFIAAELLHLEGNSQRGLRLGLIEEVEAHLHPQAQLRAIAALRKEEKVQLIVTTHSPNITSKISLENLILFDRVSAFSMRLQDTRLLRTDRLFLERFLDVTKANLFFADGVILVEGPSEELLVPSIAKWIGLDVVMSGVSVVNVGNTSMLRFSKIFCRNDARQMKIPVSVVTDVDVKPSDEGLLTENGKTKLEASRDRLLQKYNEGSICVFISPHRTLEYCLGISPFWAPLLFDALKQASILQREDGMGNREVVDDYAVLFSGFSQADIGAKIMSDYIEGGVRIGKPLLHQCLSGLIDERIEKDLLDINVLRADPMTNYLIEAILYASA